jgi:hypothetical protein
VCEKENDDTNEENGYRPKPESLKNIPFHILEKFSEK